ncbi:MAG TPA: tetratricopeptide repeat protein [Bacteroidales bacterium]|nr:tetratricopeptide repeat protein [Bacteroidales bacterium]
MKSVRRILLFSGILLLAPGIFGQEYDRSYDDIFNTAVELYKKEQYWSACLLFENLENRKQDNGASLVASYRILCDIALKDPGVETHVARWEELYPSAPLKHQIYYKLGNLLSDQTRYKDAAAVYEKVKVKRLPVSERASLAFRKGYVYMQLGNSDKAVDLFLETETYPPGEQYHWAARYYRGYIHYAKGRFQEAIPLLEPLTDIPQYGALSSVYLLQSLFYTGEYEQVINQGVPLYQNADPALRTTLAKTLSESYFALGRTEEARNFFDDYLKDARSLTLTDSYYSGILHFKLGDYERAAEQLALVGEKPDSLGQNALYHLGETYIRLRNKLQAMDAFRRASNLNFDPVIREDAFFNYAKLAFDVNRDIQVLSSYRNAYPDSPRLDEIQNYIAANYFLNRDYASAVEALQALRNPTPENLEDLKKAAFLRGIQLYQAGSFRDAERYFSLAQESYWVAECLYRSNMFGNAIQIWEQFIRKSGSFSNPEKYRTSHYNIAYAYFKQGDYSNAENWYTRYIRLGPKNNALISDTYLRLGDCAFAQYKHGQALEEYQKALDNNTIVPDYALYQIGMAEGILNREPDKIRTLDRLMQEYPSSAYYSPALFEQGRTYIQTNQYEKAEERFRIILSFDTHKAYHAKALIELGLIQINMQNPEAALDYYKEVLRRFPDSPDISDALAGIENIYLARNDSQGFFEYMESLGIDSGKTPGEKELMIFSSAEQLYLNHSHAEAVTALNNFIKEYPESEKIAAAHFYLGECLLQLGKMQMAADAFLVVMKKPSGSFTELATRNYASIQYDLEQYANAVDAYMSLNDIAVLDNNRLEAVKGLMWSFFKNKQFRNAIVQSGKVLGNKAFSKEVHQDAKYISAMSHLNLGEREEALPLLEALSGESHTAYGAEAYYLLCKDAFDSGDFEKAETMIYNFADTNTPQEYWIARSFILLGDIFAERGEWVQAKATYESVQNGYNPSKPDDIAQLTALRIQKSEEAMLQ